MVDIAKEVSNELQKKGFSVALVNARFVKPLDKKLLLELASNCPLIITMEENSQIGGFGSGVSEIYKENFISVRTLSFGVPDRFIAQGTPNDQRDNAGLSSKEILKKINEFIKKNKVFKKKNRHNVTRIKAS